MTKAELITKCGSLIKANETAYVESPTLEMAQATIDVIFEMELETQLNQQILKDVNKAINDAGIHCAISFAEAIRVLAKDRDALRQQVRAMRKAKRSR